MYDGHLYIIRLLMTRVKCDICQKELNKSYIKRHVENVHRFHNVSRTLRRNRLCSALERYGLELRPDSKLCVMYIASGVGEIEFICKRMCQMKYLFEYCNMRERLNDTEKEQLETLEAGYLPDLSVFGEAEYNVLREIGSYPTTYPWM